MDPLQLLPTAPTAEDFRALARSSPWRFRTLHLVHRPAGGSPVEGWLTRPGRLRVRLADGSEHVEEGVPYTVSVLTRDPATPEEPPPPSVDAVPGLAPRPPADPWQPRPPQAAGAPTPRLRPDGLVAERPAEVDYDDPMWQDFRWVAMLDPAELSRGVEVSQVRVVSLRGRPTWLAECRPVAGYDPRCSCCALLVGEVSRRIEAEEGADLDEIEVSSLPSAYLVGLDVETGIVASLTPLDGDLPLGFENVIHGVG